MNIDQLIKESEALDLLDQSYKMNSKILMNFRIAKVKTKNKLFKNRGVFKGYKILALITPVKEKYEK